MPLLTTAASHMVLKNVISAVEFEARQISQCT